MRPHRILAGLIPSFRTCPCRALTRPKNDDVRLALSGGPHARSAYSQIRLIGAPIRRHAIVIVNLDLAAAIPPIELLVGGKRGRGLQLVLGEIEMIGAEVTVVSQPGPRDGKMLLSDTEKAAETEHGVSNIAAELVDHQALDGADLLAAGTAHRSAFDAITGDETVRLGNRRIGLHGCLHHSFRLRYYFESLSR